MNGYYVPARVWTLAKLAATNGWEIRVEPHHASLDLLFYRDTESIDIGWLIEYNRLAERDLRPKVRLMHVSYGAADVRLRDVPKILTGGAP